MTKQNRIISGTVRGIIFITMVASILLGLFGGDEETGGSHYYMNAFTCLVMLVITLVPSYFTSRTRVIVPAVLQTMFVVFTFLAMYFGEILKYYEKFAWWDVMLHSTSGFMLGLMGFLLLYSLNEDRRVFFHMNTFCVLLFSFCFALACGAVWEIFEFTGDFFLGMNMQKSVYVTDVNELAPYVNRFGRYMDPGLLDTMKDLIVDSIGALAAVIGGYLYTLRVKKGNREFLREIEAADDAHRLALQEIEQRRLRRRGKNMPAQTDEGIEVEA